MNFSCQREGGSKISLVLPNSVNEVSLQRKKKNKNIPEEQLNQAVPDSSVLRTLLL